MNRDGDGDGAETRTEMEVNIRTQDGKGGGNRDGSGDRNESSSGDGNGNEGGNGNGNEHGIGEGGGEAEKRKRPLITRFCCGRDRALSFRTRHHLCRQGVALAGTQQLRSKGAVSVHAHRTEGVTESEAREGANGIGGGIRIEGGNGT